VIELASAADLIWRLTVELRRSRSFAEDAERKASRIGGALLFALAGYVVGARWSLWTGRGQDFSWPGLLVGVATLPIMRRHSETPTSTQCRRRARRANQTDSDPSYR
jgi:uncharacterized protein YcfJ